MHHDVTRPSEWVQRWAHLIPEHGDVLDLACGSGRHMHLLKQRGHQPIGVDRDPAALALAAAHGRVVQADIENGPWPFSDQVFAGVVVTNYLWRPLLPAIVQSVAPGGALIYETFAMGNEKFGKPSNPGFLLRPGELLSACANATPPLRVVAYEELTLDKPGRCVQRVAAMRDWAGAPPEDRKIAV
jgi:SAM-dependent methyltransferase